MTMLEQTRSPMTFEETPTQKVVRGVLEKIPKGTSAAARMLPAECYTSPEFFEFERKEVFARSWICVGSLLDIRSRRSVDRRSPHGSRRDGRTAQIGEIDSGQA